MEENNFEEYRKAVLDPSLDSAAKASIIDQAAADPGISVEELIMLWGVAFARS